jgi:hypothetical protein
LCTGTLLQTDVTTVNIEETSLFETSITVYIFKQHRVQKCAKCKGTGRSNVYYL